MDQPSHEPTPDHVNGVDNDHRSTPETKEHEHPVKEHHASVTNVLKAARNHDRDGNDPDAQAMVIASLRSQIQDLFSQVTQLNNKLVQSYDRVSNLEDDLHMASSNIRASSLKISQLELERTQHLSALNTGLLVEKSHVTAELNRLMEKATEEAAQRGQAESARADIEKDLDDLSASLFGQANTMVAEARYAQDLSERKVVAAERALKGAEEAVGLMQVQLQALQAEKEAAENNVREMQLVMGKGKWVSPQAGSEITRSLRLLSSHLPYQEFLLFIAHLRSLHATSPQPPAIPTLLPLPFLARLLTEDSETTVRLDLAPSLNWLSRRSVLSAIHNGQLTIEPMSSLTLLQESASYASQQTIPGLNSSSNNISCALCGTPIFSTSEAHSPNSTSHSRISLPSMGLTRSNLSNQSHLWSSALFKNPLSYSTTNSANNSPPATPPPRQNSFGPISPPHPAQVYIFRLSTPAAPATPSHPISFPVSLTSSSSSYASSSQSAHPPTSSLPQSQAAPRPSTIYPLCANGWCLTRLRTTCSLWAFIRTGVVDKVWEEELPALAPPPRHGTAPSLPAKSSLRDSATTNSTNVAEKPVVPPKRRGLWGMASALGEKAASWTEGDKEKDKVKEKEAEKEKEEKKEEEKKEVVPPVPRRMPPPPSHPSAAARLSLGGTPPPLPKRSAGRGAKVEATPAHDTAPASEGRSSEESSTPKEVLKEAPIMTSESSTSTQAEVFSTPAFSPSTDSINNPQDVDTTRAAPHNIPLPESRAPTPSLPPVADAPSRTASPAPGPPPLPRRAAARAARPISVIGSGDTSAPGSRSGTPAPAQGPAPAASVEPPAPVGPATHEQEAPAPADAAPSAPEGEPEARKPEGEPLDSAASVSVAAPASDEGKSEDAGSEDLDADAATVRRVDGGEEQVEASPNLKDQGLEPAESQDEPSISRDETRETEKEAVPDVKQLADEEDHFAGVKEVYVGDSTWEERTWKELVKLREEMFWARIGGLR